MIVNFVSLAMFRGLSLSSQPFIYLEREFG